MAWQQNPLGVRYLPNANTFCTVHGTAVGTGSVVALKGAVRGAIFFHNPGVVPICVYPALDANGQPQILGFGDPGTFLLTAGIALEISPCGSGAWYAVASAPGAALTTAVF